MVRKDSLSDAYKANIRKYPLLTPEEEGDLGRLLKSQKETEENKEKAKEKLIVSNLGYVVFIVSNFYQHRLTQIFGFMDAVQQGNIGLIKAVDKFDLEKGRFSTYATCWIKQYINRALKEQSKIVKVPSYVYDAYTKYLRVGDILEKELGRQPTDDEVVEYSMRLNSERPLTQNVIGYVHSANFQVFSLDQSFDSDNGESNPGFVLESGGDSIDEIVNGRILREDLRDIVESSNNLSDDEEMVISLRYFGNNGKNHTLDEIGEIRGLSRERIRQIEKNAFKKLRIKLSNLAEDFVSSYSL